MNRKETKVELENNELAHLIIEYDERFNHILGYRRMTRWINKLNSKHYNRKRIRRIMKLLGIKSVNYWQEISMHLNQMRSGLLMLLNSKLSVQNKNYI